MAGTPQRRAERERLVAQVDDFCELLLQGMSDKAACRAFGINVGALYRVEQENSDVAARLAQARKAGAAAMASETLDIADELSALPTADPVRVATARISSRQWLVARRNREEFGDAKPGVAVQVNVSGLHLTALREPPALAVATAEPLPAPLDAEPSAEAEPLSLNDLL